MPRLNFLSPQEVKEIYQAALRSLSEDEISGMGEMEAGVSGSFAQKVADRFCRLGLPPGARAGDR